MRFWFPSDAWFASLAKCEKRALVYYYYYFSFKEFFILISLNSQNLENKDLSQFSAQEKKLLRVFLAGTR